VSLSSQSEDAIRQALERAGFELIQFDARLPNIDEKLRPDVLAWASNAEGMLVPWAVIEVKNRRGHVVPELALPQLARTRDLLGTVDHYVILNGEWLRADAGLRSLEPVPAPVPPPFGGRGELADVGLATSLITEGLWEGTNQLRSQPHTSPGVDFSFPQGWVLELSQHGVETRSGTIVPVRSDVLWEARRRAMVDFTRRRSGGGEFSSHPVIARAVAALITGRLDGDLFDPFCGTGSFLWEAIDQAHQLDKGLNIVRGFDMNNRLVKLARSIGTAAPVAVEIVQADAFDADFPLSRAIVSSPPFGLRLQHPYELMDESRSIDGETAAIDRILRALAPGGRAVIQVTHAFLSRASAHPYRRYLANNFRIAAMIGCPSGSVPGTKIGSVLLVVDNGQPGETFVAQLGEDWEAQLSLGGPALEATLAFIDDSEDPESVGPR
jgi:N-6 DNA Methylase